MAKEKDAQAWVGRQSDALVGLIFVAFIPIIIPIIILDLVLLSPYRLVTFLGRQMKKHVAEKEIT